MIDIIAFIVVAVACFYVGKLHGAKHAGTNPVAAPVVPAVPVAPVTPTTPPAA
jgi:hypothetical protein